MRQKISEVLDTSRGLSKEWILTYISQEDIMRRYLGFTEIALRKTYRNPMRQDKSPGCSFYKTSKGVVKFTDWAQDVSYDCFGVVMETYMCNFWDALKIIDQDFGLGLYANREIVKVRKELTGSILKSVGEQEKLSYSYTVQDFSTSSLGYWNSYGIDGHVLETFNVFDTVDVQVNGNWYMKGEHNDPIFTYAFSSGNVKFYRPMNKEGWKWRGNTSRDDIQGLDQLPNSGEVLVITSSLKDVMVLYTMGIPAIAPQSETAISEELYSELLLKWDHIIILFDNDSPGIKAAKKFSNRFKIPYILPEEKDISDSLKLNGYAKTYDKINKDIKGVLEDVDQGRGNYGTASDREKSRE